MPLTQDVDKAFIIAAYNTVDDDLGSVGARLC